MIIQLPSSTNKTDRHEITEILLERGKEVKTASTKKDQRQIHSSLRPSETGINFQLIQHRQTQLKCRISGGFFAGGKFRDCLPNW